MKTVFLDRDGVINKDNGYVFEIDNFEFIDGVFDSFRYLQKKGYNLIIVTNQSGIGRGRYTLEDFNILNNWMLQEFQKKGVTNIDVFFCPHKPEDNCKCRKPNTGMFEAASLKYKIDNNFSWMIGDKDIDIEAALNFGIKNTILVKSIHKAENSKNSAKFVIPSIKTISDYIK